MIIRWYGTSNTGTGVTHQEHVHQIMRRVFNCIKSEEANEERGKEGERERERERGRERERERERGGTEIIIL